MGNIFQFKQFSVNQEHCAMRINTDGVLLGATASTAAPERILDIGTGTGVIALMLAQRFPQAQVWAVELDGPAAQRAALNFEASPFADRLHGVHSDIFHWKTDLQFDLIVSNPPFYINSLHNPDERRKMAKHTDVEFFTGLFAFGKARLQQEGKMQLIVPIELREALSAEANAVGLHLVEELQIRSFVDSEVFRTILTFAHSPQVLRCSSFVIYQEKAVHAEGYRQLLKDFFLAF